MPRSESTRARVGILLIGAIGAGLVSIHVNHALGDRESLQTFLSGIFIPMLFALGVFTGGIWLWRLRLDGQYVLRVAGWCALGAVALAGVATLTTVYQHGEGVTMSHQFYVFSNAASTGAVIGFITGVYDIRQRIAQQKLTQLSHQLTVLNRVLRHDIRNNANIIRGHAELIEEDSVDTAEQINTIRQRSTELVEMGKQARQVEQLLQADDLRIDPVEIVSLIESSCEQLAREYPDSIIDTALPDELVVYGHPLIESALRNVLENAIEHNETETPRVSVESVAPSQGRTDLVEIRIADNGPGIPDREREVLERGYETPLEHTSGLGLWLVNWIVIESGGQVGFEENDPTGSIICLRFERPQTGSPPNPPLESPVADGRPL